MRVNLGLALVISLGFVKYTQADVVGCSAEVDANIWNLNSIRRSQEDGDYVVPLSNSQGNNKTVMYFNLCSNTYNKCKLASEDVGDEDDDFANIVLPDGTCHRLTQDDMDEATATYLNPNSTDYGLRLKFESKEQCTESEKYSLTVDIKCDQEAKTPIPRIQTDSVSESMCHPRIYLDSQAGCINQSFNKVWKFCEDLVEEFGITIIIIGFFLTFFGARFPSATLFIAGTTAGLLVAITIIYGLILPDFTPDWGHMVAFLMATLFGLVLGLLSAQFTKFGVFLLGGWLGGTSGMMLYNAFISQLIGSGSKAQTGMIAVIVIFVALGGILLIYLFDHALAVGSSIVGAYALVRGFGIFIGGFPNEYLVYLELSNGSYAAMPDEFYIYLGVYVLIAIIGFIVQERELLKKVIKNRRKGKKGKKGGHDMEESKHDDFEEEPLVKKDKKHKR